MKDYSNQYVQIVCKHLGTPFADIFSKRRLRRLCEGRQMISFLLRKYTKMNFNDISEKVGYKNHASSIRDVRIIGWWLENNSGFARRMEPLLAEAKKLAEMIKNKEKNPEAAEPGDLCWFWHDGDKYPKLGLLFHKYYNKDTKPCYISFQDPDVVYSNCAFAGEAVLPRCFHIDIAAGVPAGVPVN